MIRNDKTRRLAIKVKLGILLFYCAVIIVIYCIS